MNLISIVTPTYNEEDNIENFCNEVKNQMSKLSYDYEHIIIDNCSEDKTASIVKKLIMDDIKIKLIVNNKNYGHLRSPVHGILQSKGDATVLINADFQDPPDLIGKLISEWSLGKKIVLLQKKKSDENKIYFFLRKFFYQTLNRLSETQLTINTTGSGIFDKSIIEELRKINDPCPYFRGLVADLGPKIDLIEFDQPKRKLGKTKNNFLTLLDTAILGFVKHSKWPLRFMTILGSIISLCSIFIAIIFFFLKLIFWNSFDLGTAPLLIGIFAIGGFQILFLGLLGEYINIILSHVRNLPLVIEKERINFD